MSSSRKKEPPVIPVIGQGGDSSREEQLRQWEESERQRREQQAAAAAPSLPAAVPAQPVSPPVLPAEGVLDTSADTPAPLVTVREVPGYLEMPAYTEPDSADPSERLEFYSRGILAVQYAARANHERADQQKLIGLGLRLRAMKEEELHKVAGFDTFGDLAEDRFGIKKHQANNIIRVTPVAQALEHITTQELKERPLRILVPILDTHGESAVRETWQEASRHGNVTDKALIQAANFLGYAPPKELTTGDEKKTDKPSSAASEALKAVERIRALAETDLARARQEAQELESAVRELLEELAGNLE
ncbi:hypothetical protein OIA45_48895 (plasmid) [Streptomyces chartreusis]|uniref:hypothetical protein n=1 Tax=Streptomyces chartreusis TaxID=1969 RepID=UPI0037DC5DCD|nr:hypothetical protein OIA45_48895 [Streptomyces chartreusis]